jgi:hypothetical protein
MLAIWSLSKSMDFSKKGDLQDQYSWPGALAKFVSRWLCGRQEKVDRLAITTCARIRMDCFTSLQQRRKIA